MPEIRSPRDGGAMLRALGDATPELVGFLISFAVIARYRWAHHAFFSSVAAVDRPLIALNLVYPGSIASCPSPRR